MAEYFYWSAVDTLDILGSVPSKPSIWPNPTEMPPVVNLAFVLLVYPPLLLGDMAIWLE